MRLARESIGLLHRFSEGGPWANCSWPSKYRYYIALDILDHNPLQQINEASPWKHWTIAYVLNRQSMGQMWPANMYYSALCQFQYGYKPVDNGVYLVVGFLFVTFCGTFIVCRIIWEPFDYWKQISHDIADDMDAKAWMEHGAVDKG